MNCIFFFWIKEESTSNAILFGIIGAVIAAIITLIVILIILIIYKKRKDGSTSDESSIEADDEILALTLDQASSHTISLFTSSVIDDSDPFRDDFMESSIEDDY